MATNFRSDRVIVKLNRIAPSSAITNLQAKISSHSYSPTKKPGFWIEIDSF